MKFVPESLEESQNFERGMDPKAAMQLGKFIEIKSVKAYYASDHTLREQGGDLVLTDFVNNRVGKYWRDFRFIDTEGEILMPKDVLGHLVRYRGKVYDLSKNIYVSKIKESQNFERGLDPKDSMGIGNPLARLADELGMTYAEIRQDKKDLQQIVDAALNPGDTEDKDYEFAFYAVADDPMAYDISRDSRLFDVALWADDHKKDAIKILRTPDIVAESVNFERGKSPEQIKRLFGKEYKPGEIILRPDNGYSPHTTIMMFKRKTPPDYAGEEYYEVATLGYIDTEGKIKPYGSRFAMDDYNTRNLVDTDTNTWFPSTEEAENIKKFLNQSKISKIKSRIGIYPILNGKTLTLNEALDFERGIDPKKAAGVGLTAPRRFKTIEELTDFLIAALPLIFGGKIPEDILSRKEGGMLPESYYGKIAWWLSEHGMEMSDGNSDWEARVEMVPKEFAFWPTLLVQRLEKMLGQKRWTEYD